MSKFGIRNLKSKSGERIALNVGYNSAIALKNEQLIFYRASIEWVDDKISKVVLY